MLDSQKKDNAKRQADYRKRHLKEGTAQRLNVILALDAKQALERLAKRHGLSHKDMLERLLIEADVDLK